jgi:lipopolysaccharide biosynthesis glycosyltransferase
MNKQRTIVLVLRSGKDFSLCDVDLITKHINEKWKSEIHPRIICLCDKFTQKYDLGDFECIPLANNYPGTWSRMQLYSSEMEQYRPFLYVDLDTAVIGSLENIFDLVKDESKFIALEDFYQKKQLATGLVWFPANSQKIKDVWMMWNPKEIKGSRMDYFLRKYLVPDMYWQQLTNTICDFKPKSHVLLNDLPIGCNLVCFHGKPRIYQVKNIKWVNEYINF